MKFVLIFILMIHCSVLMAQSNESKMFSLNKKVIYKTKGAGAEKMRDMLTDFFRDKNLLAGKISRRAEDTIFITQYPDNKKVAEHRIDIYKHSLEIYYRGDIGRRKAYDELVSKYYKMTGNKHFLMDTTTYTNHIDLTNINVNGSELNEIIGWAISRGFNEVYIKLYSPDGISVASPHYDIFNPKEQLSKIDMYSAVELSNLLKPYTKKTKFVFVFDFSNDEKSYFKQVMGYNALSDEGCRVLKSFVSELVPLLKIGTFEVLYDNNDLKRECYIEPLFNTIDKTGAKIVILNSMNNK